MADTQTVVSAPAVAPKSKAPKAKAPVALPAPTVPVEIAAPVKAKAPKTPTPVAAPVAEVAPVVATPATAPKAKAPKAKGASPVAATVAPPGAKEVKVPTPRVKAELTPQRIEVLKLISATPAGLGRKVIGETLAIKSGFCSLLGHADADKVEANSLVGKGFLKVVAVEGAATVYQITPEGQAALARAMTPVVTA